MLRHLSSRLSNRYLSTLHSTCTRYLSTLDLHFARDSLQETVSAAFPDVPITLPPAGSQLRISDIQTDSPEVTEFIASYYEQFTDQVIPLEAPVGSLHRKVFTPDALRGILKGAKEYKWAELTEDGVYVVAQRDHMSNYATIVTKRLLPILRQNLTSVTIAKPVTPCPMVDKIWSMFNASGRVMIEEVDGCWVVSGCDKDVRQVAHLCEGLVDYRNAAMTSTLQDMDINQLTDSKILFLPVTSRPLCYST